MRVQTNPYLANRVVRPDPKIRLFCFPYAGGTAAVFQRWHPIFPQWVEICPIQYPGRGNRMRERPFTNVPPLAQEIAEAITPLLDLPFAFFGHSMGALIQFELARELWKKQNKQPVHLFASSSRAPQFPNRDRISYDLAEPEFIEELRHLNGTPPEVLEHKELMALMLPLLRADFAVSQTYFCLEERQLSCPLSALGGEADPSVSIDELEGWGKQTTGAFSLQMFPGDHFYLHGSETALTQRVITSLIQSGEFGS